LTVKSMWRINAVTPKQAHIGGRPDNAQALG
jgi:hypothetical protein